MRSRLQTVLAAGCLVVLCTGESFAADLFGDDPGALLRRDVVAVEASVGHLSGLAHEYVYSRTGAKLSQLDWRTEHAAVIGGRLTFRPLDWLSLRARGWASADSDAKLKDYDWLAGYIGFNSWTHYSRSPDTDLNRGLQGDLSLAAWFWQDDGFALAAIGGYRYQTQKWGASGGSFVYSVNAFRDTIGTLPNQLGIRYQQWWETPYLGLGVSYTVDDLVLSGEVIGSGWAKGRDEDLHALRHLLFEEKFGSAPMIGATIGAEYRLTPMLSATGRVEYERYFEAEGSTKVTDQSTGAVYYSPKRSAGADNENVLISLGLKARL